MLPENTIHKKAVIEFLTKLVQDPKSHPKSRRQSIRSELFDEIIGCFQEEFDYWPDEVEGERVVDLATLTDDRRGLFRRDHQATARNAALTVEKSGTLRFSVLNALAGDVRDRPDDGGGLTRDELARLLNRSSNSIRPRVKELIDGGFVKGATYSSGIGKTRKTPLGRDAEVLVPTEKGWSALAAVARNEGLEFTR